MRIGSLFVHKSGHLEVKSSLTCTPAKSVRRTYCEVYPEEAKVKAELFSC